MLSHILFFHLHLPSKKTYVIEYGIVILENYVQVIDCKHFDKQEERRAHMLPSFNLNWLSLFELQKVRKVFWIKTSKNLEDKENSFSRIPVCL